MANQTHGFHTGMKKMVKTSIFKILLVHTLQFSSCIFSLTIQNGNWFVKCLCSVPAVTMYTGGGGIVVVVSLLLLLLISRLTAFA